MTEQTQHGPYKLTYDTLKSINGERRALDWHMAMMRGEAHARDVMLEVEVLRETYQEKKREEEDYVEDFITYARPYLSSTV